MNIIWMVVSDHIKKVNLFIIQQYIYMVINIGHVWSVSLFGQL